MFGDIRTKIFFSRIKEKKAWMKMLLHILTSKSFINNLFKNMVQPSWISINEKQNKTYICVFFLYQLTVIHCTSLVISISQWSSSLGLAKILVLRKGKRKREKNYQKYVNKLSFFPLLFLSTDQSKNLPKICICSLHVYFLFYFPIVSCFIAKYFSIV